VPTGVSIIIASHNTRAHLERCLSALGDAHQLIVVDTASTDGSQGLVRRSFPHVRLIQLDSNPGYGGALNEGIAHASGTDPLLMNADAWPLADAVENLVQFAEGEPRAGIVGPRLLNPDGSLQASVRGFPTLWRLATEYLFLRWLAPRSRALNAFYGSCFDHRSRRDAEFLVGAVLLVRRQVVTDIGGFDTDFFMFNEEVDFCYRARSARRRSSSGPVRSSFTSAEPRLPRRRCRCTTSSFGPICASSPNTTVSSEQSARRLLVVAMRARAVVFGIAGQPARRRISAGP
jgi:N-acetylglucosaminyl-diphospho-decaprenol L-rhamnosyltransferase